MKTMGRTWSWVWLVALGACGSFAQPPTPQFGTVGDDGGTGLIDSDGGGVMDPPDAFVGFDAEPVDAFVPLDGPVIDGAPQGTPPTAGTVTVSGTTDSGKTLTISDSGWSLGMPTGALHYKWQRCGDNACASASTVGSDATTYALSSADGGNYIRGGVYAVNSCSSGCGQTATVYSSIHGPVRSVTTSKGSSICVTGCCSSACAIVKVSLKGFSTGSHSFDIWSNKYSTAWKIYSSSSNPSEYAVWGYGGTTVWSVVDGLKSNVITW